MKRQDEIRKTAKAPAREGGKVKAR